MGTYSAKLLQACFHLHTRRYPCCAPSHCSKTFAGNTVVAVPCDLYCDRRLGRGQVIRRQALIPSLPLFPASNESKCRSYITSQSGKQTGRNDERLKLCPCGVTASHVIHLMRKTPGYNSIYYECVCHSKCRHQQSRRVIC